MKKYKVLIAGLITGPILALFVWSASISGVPIQDTDTAFAQIGYGGSGGSGGGPGGGSGGSGGSFDFGDFDFGDFFDDFFD